MLKLHVEVTCNQRKFISFPCFLDAYTTDDIKYEWKATRPIQLKDGLRKSLPSFELQEVKTDYCTSKTNTGKEFTI